PPERVVGLVELGRVDHQSVADPQRVEELALAKGRSAEPPQVGRHAAHEQRIEQRTQVVRRLAVDVEGYEIAFDRARQRGSPDVGRDPRIEVTSPDGGLLPDHDRLGRMLQRDRPGGSLGHLCLRVGGRDPDQGHHAVARVEVLIVPRLGAGELVPDLPEGVQHIGHPHPLSVPYRLRVLLGGAHGRCHSLPSAFSSCVAGWGPQVPAAYVASGGRPLRHAFSIGSTSVHAASTSSARVNSVGSPIMQSSSNRSYASGASTRNDVTYWKSIVTLRMRSPALGTLAPNLSEIPSSG